MPFMVIYSTSDGSSCYEQADAIDEAAHLVERLRNKEGLDQIRIYRMEEISFAFRPYYKVELGLNDRPSMPSPPSARSDVEVEGPGPEPQADARPAVARPTPPPADADDKTAGANGPRGLFGR